MYQIIFWHSNIDGFILFKSNCIIKCGCNNVGNFLKAICCPGAYGILFMYNNFFPIINPAMPKLMDKWVPKQTIASGFSLNILKIADVNPMTILIIWQIIFGIILYFNVFTT